MFTGCTVKEPHSASFSPLPTSEQKRHLRLLIIEDEEQLARSLARYFEGAYAVQTAVSGSQGMAIAEKIQPDWVLLDLHLPEIGGLTVLESLQRFPSPPLVIIMTGYGDIRSAVQAIKLGAADYVTKPFNVEQLHHDVQQLLHLRNHKLPHEKSNFSLGERRIVGQGPQMQKVWEVVEKFAPTNFPILLYGESGTGKELFARAIHTLSKRAQGPFVAVDCATIPASLWESEFFGYEKGAFTGAHQSKPGIFALAHGGTLFLDEIGNLDVLLQAKLLRVLQEGEVRPLGAQRTIHPDVRIIAASNVDLAQQAMQGTFRADLYYRLSAATISLPPLRRREDIPLLIQYFLDIYGQELGKSLHITPEAIQFLTRYQWPGNCRELQNVIRSTIPFVEREIHPHHLPVYIRQSIEESPVSQDNPQQDNPQERVGSPQKIALNIALHIDLQNGTDLKKIGGQVAKTVEGEIIKTVRSFGLSQAELASLFHVDPKTLRARLKTGEACEE